MIYRTFVTLAVVFLATGCAAMREEKRREGAVQQASEDLKRAAAEFDKESSREFKALSNPTPTPASAKGISL
jgi:hypothetical protein